MSYTSLLRLMGQEFRGQDHKDRVFLKLKLQKSEFSKPSGGVLTVVCATYLHVTPFF